MEDTNSTSTGKILCRSRKSVLKIIDIVNSEISKIVDQQEFVSNEEKSKYTERFVEVFKSALLQNILVDGLTWEESLSQQSDDCTKEYEAFDKEKFHHMQSVLIPQYDDALTNLTKKRRECPQKCKDTLVKKINDDIAHMARAKIINNQRDDLSHLPNDKHCEVSSESESIRMMAENLRIPNTLDRIENLKRAEEIHKKIKDSRTSELISNVPNGFSQLDSVSFGDYLQMRNLSHKNNIATSDKKRKRNNEIVWTSAMEIS